VQFDWRNDQTLREFVRDQWAAGKSARVIAAEWTHQHPARPMTKNNVVGAVHRHKLGEARPSPLHDRRAEPADRSPSAAAPEMPALKAAGVLVAPPPVYASPWVSALAAPVIVAPPKPVAAAPLSRVGLRCQWLNGSGSPNWDQCTTGATHGRAESSWCNHHRARVFGRRGYGTEAA